VAPATVKFSGAPTVSRLPGGDVNTISIFVVVVALELEKVGTCEKTEDEVRNRMVNSPNAYPSAFDKLDMPILERAAVTELLRAARLFRQVGGKIILITSDKSLL
jgi:hypothetical protein